MFCLLLLTLKEEMQNIVGERSDSNWLERTVGGLKVKVHREMICESASSCLNYSLPHTWVSDCGIWKKTCCVFLPLHVI